MREILFILLASVTFCYCQLDGKFWWTDSRVAKYKKVKIPEPVMEDINPYETDESVKIVFRDESPSENSVHLKPIYYEKFISNTSTDICNYVKRYECRGIIYSAKYGKSANKGPRDPQLVCCLEAPKQPLKEDTRIYFPGFRENNNYIRHISKRSVKINVGRPRKVVESETDYDEDPYWNIKNSNFQNSHLSQSDDVRQDSVDELPRPGLIGIYSDTGKRPEWSIQDQDSTPSYGGEFEYDEVDDIPSFGYSSIDPRRETKRKRRKLRPLKLQTSSEEIPYNPRNHIISFQANPDFKVLEGFKLLNLVKVNKNRHEEVNDDNQNEETVSSEPLESSSSKSKEYYSAENDEIFSECGKSVQIKEKGQQRGEAPVGSHPWLALVTRTRRRNIYLCYGTLVHTRAAITVASCVNNKTSPGELTLISGMQYLNRRPRTSSRISKVILHPDYRPGDLANNLALLILEIPLQLNVNIQPACLADPISGQNCMFFGWGGFESDTRTRSRWQRGKIRACTSRIMSKGENLSSGLFCARVEPQHSLVTGTGGPLICSVNGRDTVVGVLVTIRQTLILLPVRDWTMESADVIHEDK